MQNKTKLFQSNVDNIYIHHKNKPNYKGGSMQRKHQEFISRKYMKVDRYGFLVPMTEDEKTEKIKSDKQLAKYFK